MFDQLGFICNGIWFCLHRQQLISRHVSMFILHYTLNSEWAILSNRLTHYVIQYACSACSFSVNCFLDTSALVCLKKESCTYDLLNRQKPNQLSSGDADWYWNWSSFGFQLEQEGILKGGGAVGGVLWVNFDKLLRGKRVQSGRHTLRMCNEFLLSVWVVALWQVLGNIRNISLSLSRSHFRLCVSFCLPCGTSENLLSPIKWTRQAL